MLNMAKSLEHINLLDQLGVKNTALHKIHPLSKLLVTLVFIVTVISFGQHEINNLLPLVLFPMILISVGDIPTLPLLKRVLIALPFIIGVGIMNPIFDQRTMLTLGNMSISYGWISFFSLLIKGILTIFTSLVLIASTGINRLSLAMRMMKIPKILVLQFLLTYRYISILIEEAMRSTIAYSLRSPSQKGVKLKDFGSLLGQLLLRTIARAERVYAAMCCRGFDGEYNTGQNLKMKYKDYMYLMVWIAFFAVIRFLHPADLIGKFITGVIL